MARICVCCLLLGFWLLRLLSQSPENATPLQGIPGQCYLTEPIISGTVEGDNPCSITHHSGGLMSARRNRASHAKCSHETVKYLVVAGDYGYGCIIGADASKGWQEWRLRRCACYLRMCVRAYTPVCGLCGGPRTATATKPKFHDEPNFDNNWK